jgi:Acyl-CoA dehydrogenase, C-terminal domain
VFVAKLAELGSCLARPASRFGSFQTLSTRMPYRPRRREGPPGGKLNDGGLLRGLGEARAICDAARLIAYRVIDERARQRPPSPYAYLARAAMIRAERAVASLALEVLGSEALMLRTVGSRRSLRSPLCSSRVRLRDSCPQHAVGACPEDGQMQNPTVT